MAAVTSAATGAINAYETGGASLVIVIAMLILFGAAGYFVGRLYGPVGIYATIGAFFTFIIGLWALGSLSFG
jgi:hypothetical protein